MSRSQSRASFSQRPSSAQSQSSASSLATNATQQYSQFVSRRPAAIEDGSRLGGLSKQQYDRLSTTLASAKKGSTATRTGSDDEDFLEADQTAVMPDLTEKIPRSSHPKVTKPPAVDLPKRRSVNGSPKIKQSLPTVPRINTDERSKPQSNIPLDIQEALLVEDLLVVLIGIEGHYISLPGPDAVQDKTFLIDDSLDASLRQLAKQIMPLSSYYQTIDAFVQRSTDLHQGLTNHALAAAIRDELDRYLVLVAQLQHQFASAKAFSLKRFWLYVQDALHSLSLICNLIQELNRQPPPTAVDDSDSDDSDQDAQGPGSAGLKAILAQMKGGGQSAWSQGGQVKGGEVLAVIDEMLQKTAGDKRAHDLYSRLLLKASQPYRKMLLEWIGAGHLADEHDEFMVRETRSITRGSLEVDYVDEYWERRYTLKDMPLSSGGSPTVAVRPQLSQSVTRAAAREQGRGGGQVIPAFLEEWKAKTLLAGKYLNVLRECGMAIEPPALVTGDAQDSQAINDDSFYARIDAAYAYANQTLLRMLMTQEQLSARLKSIKHYFFMDQGDSFTHFLDLSAHELSKKTKHISLSKLQNLLDLAIRNPASASSSDPYKEDVRVGIMASSLADMLMRIVSVSGALPSNAQDIADMDLASKKDDISSKDKKEALTGIEAFTLEYTVTFPLSLVISRKTILKYQMIFRHLLQLKNLEHLLSSVWLEQTKSPLWRKRSPFSELEQWKGRVVALRTRMLIYLKEMYDFAVHMVLEPNWRILDEQLGKAETVDQLLKDHADFLDTCLKSCMLTNAEMIQVQSKLVHCISLYITYASHFSKMAASATLDLEVVGGEWSAIDTDSMERTLGKIESFFTHWVTTHAEKVNYISTSDSVALIALHQRLAPLKKRAGENDSAGFRGQ